MERIKALSNGTKIMLGAGALLFLDLFLTWQNLKISYGRSGTATQYLDGWDFWGLLIGLATLGLLALVIVLRLTDIEVSPDVPWNAITLALGVLIFVLTLVKNITDADSSWASYVGVVLGALVVAGAYLDRAQTRSVEPRAELEEV